ncbi:hypothetical protein [Cohnella yongneupensis]|uniref:Uncharacterized protein n=1 Tax=Cohnella yongneupensis TaxID=425006 RepID=A0ABW0QYG6_9BACL
MRQRIIMAGLGASVWAVSTLFFLLLGDWILPSEGERLGSSLFLLLLLTFLLLIGAAVFVRLRVFREKGSATRFGYVATVIGLVLNSITISNRDSVFPKFDSFQHQSFTVWMTAAYALTLIVPAIVDRMIKEPEHAAHAAPQEDIVPNESVHSPHPHAGSQE